MLVTSDDVADGRRADVKRGCQVLDRPKYTWRAMQRFSF